MITPPGNQRWRGRTASFLSTKARFDPARYDVCAMPRDGEARAFVEAHHYSGSYPAARFRFGLHGPAGLEGVAVFSHPVRDEVLTNALPGLAAATEGVELGRFVLLDSAGFNAETWFLSRCLDSLRRAGVRGVVSFSDPFPRETLDGRRVFAGHLGTIYQASSAVYASRGSARTILLLPDARVLSERAVSKLRARAGPCADCGGCTRCTGWRYAADLLRTPGVLPPDADGVGPWLAARLRVMVRRVRHPGNHRYIFPLDGRVRRLVGAGGVYPRRAG